MRVEEDGNAAVAQLLEQDADDAARLVAEAVAAGRRVYGVRVLTSTLEDTYLEAVGDEVS